MPRRDCLNVWDNPNCDDGRPPMVDYPRYSSSGSSYSDMHHWDLKIPGEHTLEDQEPFDMEIQMFHTHLSDERLNSIGIPIRATQDGYNAAFQLVLNEFQDVYDYNQMICARRKRRLRTRRSKEQQQQQQAEEDDSDDSQPVPSSASSSSDTDASDDDYEVFFNDEYYNNGAINDDYEFYYNDEYYNNYTFDDIDFVSSTSSNSTDSSRNLRYNRNRRLFTRKFDPYSDDFMTTIFFYRYDGSITEPPCIDISWWVMNEPMLVSTTQLQQAKRILFTNVDPESSCQPTSVHNSDQQVTRPIQPLGSNRDIQHCHEGDFISDIEKGRNPGKRCR